MKTIDDYILNEPDYLKKLENVYYFKKVEGINFDNSVLFKTELARMFIEKMNIDVDKNLTITSCLLYACKKDKNETDKVQKFFYVKDSIDYLEKIGFSDKVCNVFKYMCIDSKEERPRECDIIELVDGFGDLVLNREDRMGYSVDEALNLLVNRNLKNRNNVFLKKFEDFIKMEEGVNL